MMSADYREAARRIRVIGNWMLAAGGSIFGILLIAGLAQSIWTWRATSLPVFDALLLVLPGVGVRLLAWVVDGLAGPSVREGAHAMNVAKASK